MKRLIWINIILMALVTQTNAQEQLSIRQQADKNYERYEYFKSLNLYLKIAGKREGDVQLMERVADCYRNINKYNDAEIWYAKISTSTKASKMSHYYYAGVLLRNQKFDLAKQQYQLFFAGDSVGLALKLANCDSAALWMKQSPRYLVKDEPNLNTPYSDWGLSYDGNAGLLLTSDRVADNDQVDERTSNNWFKLYQATSKTDQPQPLTLGNNSNENFAGNYHIGPMALNSTADTAYITVTTEIPGKHIETDQSGKNSQRLFTRRLQLLIAKKINGRWVITGSFAYNNIQKYSVSSAALSKDDKLIYFTSDMPGGEGKTDIWYCQRRPDGTWDKPVNCGKNINTKDDEDFPYISNDGYLNYSSKGLSGMGGYDIYRVKGTKNEWKTPENMKYPINTTSDDFYLVTRDGLSGYFSSNREGGQGSDDIYSFTHINDTVPVKLVKNPVKPSAGQAMPPDIARDYALSVIYYDLDKSTIRPDAAIILNKLVVILKQYPSLKIEVASYTDSRASSEYNLSLSKRRAISATDYLIEMGIASNRIIYNGYGKSNLINKCANGVNCTEAEHQLNRRTEFKLLK